MEYSNDLNPLLDPLPPGAKNDPRALHSRLVQLVLLIHDQDEQWWNSQQALNDMDLRLVEKELQRFEPQRFVALWNSRYQRKYPLDQLERFPARSLFLALLNLLEGA